jgi:hypothetical protein
LDNQSLFPYSPNVNLNGRYPASLDDYAYPTRMAVPKLIGKVPDASGFGLVVRVDGCLSCEKHN